MLFWTSAAYVAAKTEAMKSAEAKLMDFARRFRLEQEPSSDSYDMTLTDTELPSSILPLRKHPQEHVVMHGIHVTRNNNHTPAPSPTSPSTPPLVMIHGYMNGALYFYRNLLGLANHFQSVFSLDLMGWGLSSRPTFALKDDSVETAEDFFVASLEAWRRKNNVDKMILAGHSMGGYLSVAYCEKYPERVDRLILLSPVGVPHKSEEEISNGLATASWSRWFLFSFFRQMWSAGTTPGTVMRTLPEAKGRQLVETYIDRRLPAISESDEKSALSEYLYTNSILPGSGEYGLQPILNPGAFAKKPTIFRIPNLKVRNISFLYGAHDWMDIQGGMDVQRICQERQQNGETTPDIEVYKIPEAGHLLMLENWKAFNEAVIQAATGQVSKTSQLETSTGQYSSSLKNSVPRKEKVVASETSESSSGGVRVSA
jgi:cardiolipin-specific phospholipase